mmetsp:Transcript_94114/g.249896  ORF Transcript_94114/g.249896 Transcript_94114/m.249896 type:complete len:136 (-) Transcript_94114:13-420(-)|eukprot:CAMPEP_0171195980 /NCGR_PEP_ID=MMETSP0790-20130122/21670_1 /TAXON_ID=2925 /ORGANISM="Alexandrium catenella, Strain OF101" /LENGTH=135 /DNA_ID=CAMNT_0011661197 /DNA_START=81 /DNA_END=488 /DNA_ORIENTATION=-
MGDAMSRCCGSQTVTDTDMKPNVLPVEPGPDSWSSSPDKTKSSGSTYRVRLDRTEGKPLGMKADHHSGGMLLVSTITANGLIQAWNEANPSTRVREGDRIIEVNGKKKDVNRLIEECQKKQVLEITLTRNESARM